MRLVPVIRQPPEKTWHRAPALLALHALKPLLGIWLTIPMRFKTSPEEYAERARIIRRQVETMTNADVRRELLAIAERYEELAAGIERPRRAG